jgi:hypothetical protein
MIRWYGGTRRLRVCSDGFVRGVATVGSAGASDMIETPDAGRDDTVIVFRRPATFHRFAGSVGNLDAASKNPAHPWARHSVAEFVFSRR